MKAGVAKISQHPLSTLNFESGRCETLQTPSFPKKAVIAGVGKVLKHPQWKLKVYIDVDPTGAGSKGCIRPVLMTFELKTLQQVG